MQTRVLIVDYTTHHPEVVGALLTLFAAQRTQLAVTESFRAKYLAPGGDPALAGAGRTFVRRKDEPERRWLEQLAPVVADQDVVIFATPLKSRLLARTLALQGGRKVLFLHNVNYFLGIESLDLATFARLHALPAWRAWPAWWLQRRKARREARRQRRERADFAALRPLVDAWCFGSDSVAEYFRARSGANATLLLPTNARVATRSACPPYAGQLHVAIVGMVTQARKDYRGVIAALIGADLRRPVVLSLLGSCADPALAHELAELVRRNANPRLEIRFDPARPYIPADELRTLLADVHVLLSPIQPDTEFKFHREVYGQSKVSGAEGDCLAHGRPLLLPRSYACASFIAPLVIGYGDMRELVAAIDELNDAAALRARCERVEAALAADLHGRLAAQFLAACAG